jgi:hypothetical protein
VTVEEHIKAWHIAMQKRRENELKKQATKVVRKAKEQRQ